MPNPETVLIASPLEAERVEHLRALAPGRLRVLYGAALLPQARYVADHNRKRWLPA